VRRQGELVSVTVHDRGPRIPESDLPNIFKLFVQSARHDRGDGLGIGLALANDVVKLHGGSIEARSAADDGGAEFEVRLPVAAFSASELESRHEGLSSVPCSRSRGTRFASFTTAARPSKSRRRFLRSSSACP
jgi:DNA topoisomerase VI subunit B